MFAQLLQIVVALCGGLLFDRLGMPAAWVTGPILATVIWNVTGRSRPLLPAIADAGMLFSGVIMGSAVTPEMVAAMARYPLSLVILALALFTMTAASAAYLNKVAGWRWDDAVLSSVPGSLSAVLIIAAERGSNMPKIGIAQSLRLFFLVTVLPALIALGGIAPPPVADIRPAIGPPELLALLVASILASKLLDRLGIAASMLVAGTVVSALAHGTGLVNGNVPPAIAQLAFVLVGLFVGQRFNVVEGHMLRSTLPASFAAFAIAISVAALFSLFAAWAAGIGFADALVAFSPGALEVMSILGLLLGLDPVFITAHHLARFLLLGMVVPMAFRRVPRP